jgi:putative ABC transport system permease protein
MTQAFWPNESAIGQYVSLRLPGQPGLWEIIGEADDLRQEGFATPPEPAAFILADQIPSLYMCLVLRTSADPHGSIKPALRVIYDLDSDVTASDIATMEEILAASIASRRFSMVLLAGFAGLALLLAGLGIYAVVAYSVAERTHEVGVRLALGAEPKEVVRLIVWQSMRTVGFGMILGVFAAWGVTGLLSDLLFGVTRTDPLTFIASSSCFVAVGFCASYIPAMRITKVDPASALHYE